jgi:Tfp pilus assembly protein PilO
MKISKTQQYMIGAVVVILGVIFAYYQFILKPLNNDITVLQADLADKQAKLDEAKETLAKYDEFKKRSAAVDRELEWALGRMPVFVDKAKFIENVNELQTKSGIVLTSFRFQGPAAGGKDAYTEVPADIKFIASYAQLLNFLYQTSISKSLMIVHDMKITPVGALSANSDQILSVQTTLSGIQGKNNAK